MLKQDETLLITVFFDDEKCFRWENLLQKVVYFWPEGLLAIAKSNAPRRQ